MTPDNWCQRCGLPRAVDDHDDGAPGVCSKSLSSFGAIACYERALSQREERLKFISDVLSLEDGREYGNLWSNDSINWRTDGEYAPATFWVNCNDLFYWACADGEKLMPENLPALRKSVAEARAALGGKPDAHPIEDKAAWDANWEGGSWGSLLFCARQRGMRPQPPYYDSIPEQLKPLFDACGPERDPKECG